MKRNKTHVLAFIVAICLIACQNNQKKADNIPLTVTEVDNIQQKEHVPGQWSVDKDHSKIAFIVSHHGISEVDGYFKKFQAKVTADKADLSDAVFDITVETSSIFTDHEERDNELKNVEMFNVEKFPLITFKSTSFQKADGNKFIMQGDLTIKGVTKKITLDGTLNGPTAHPDPNNKSQQFGIKAEGVIKRSDFGIGAGLTSAFVSDEVHIRATAGFEKL